MKKGILGRKVGMTQVFSKDGKLIPVTVISVEPNTVMQVKTLESDGYNAIQLGVVDKKEKNSSRASIGHAKKANTTPKRFLKEIRDVEATYSVGDKISADIFEVGEVVDVTGTSKGKGFAGTIKRYNHSRLRMSHGTSACHRIVGSMGPIKGNMKGKKMPGHMGHVQVTVQNLEIVRVDAENNLLLVKGSVPGPKKSLITIKEAVKSYK